MRVYILYNISALDNASSTLALEFERQKVFAEREMKYARLSVVLFKSTSEKQDNKMRAKRA